MCVRLKCEIPSQTLAPHTHPHTLTPSHPHSHATNVVVRIPVPKATVSSSHEPLGPGQTSELRVTEKCYLWKLKKVHGGEELLLLLRVCEGV